MKRDGDESLHDEEERACVPPLETSKKRCHYSADEQLFRLSRECYQSFAGMKSLTPRMASESRLLRKKNLRPLSAEQAMSWFTRRKTLPSLLNTEQVASLSERSQRKENQDVMLQFKNRHEVFVAGIFDGHGKNGKIAAETAAELFREGLSDFKLTFDPLESTAVASRYLADDDTAAFAERAEPFSPECVKNRITEVFRKVQAEIGPAVVHPDKVNLRWSGTTVTILLLQDGKAVVANVGDSQAILSHRSSKCSSMAGKQDLKTSELTSSEMKILTKLHRPEDDEERERVERAGARVLRGRLYLSELRMPGLMLTRSIGDLAAHAELGLTCDPSVHEFEIKKEDEFIILASDGVWDFVDPAVAVALLHDEFAASHATKRLVASALQRQDARTCDNTSAIVIFLEDLLDRQFRIKWNEKEHGMQAPSGLVAKEDAAEQTNVSSSTIVIEKKTEEKIVKNTTTAEQLEVEPAAELKETKRVRGARGVVAVDSEFCTLI